MHTSDGDLNFWKFICKFKFIIEIMKYYPSMDMCVGIYVLLYVNKNLDTIMAVCISFNRFLKKSLALLQPGQNSFFVSLRDVISWINYSIMLLSLCIRQRGLYTLRLGQNGCHFADNILKFIFLNMKIVVFWLKFYWKLFSRVHLNHWCWVTHICVSKLISIGSASGLSPCWRQTIIGTNAGILLIGPLETNFSEILIEIYTFSFNKMHLKMLSVKWWQFLSLPLCVNG